MIDKLLKLACIVVFAGYLATVMFASTADALLLSSSTCEDNAAGATSVPCDTCISSTAGEICACLDCWCGTFLADNCPP